MKIFIINGKLNGMAKLSNKLSFSGKGFEEVEDVVLFDGKDIQVFNAKKLKNNLVEEKIQAILLLSENQDLLGIGSVCGKIDTAYILQKYILLKEKQTFEGNITKSSKFNDTEKATEKKFANNTSKIDSNLQFNSVCESEVSKKEMENKENLQTISKQNEEKDANKTEQNSCFSEDNDKRCNEIQTKDLETESNIENLQPKEFEIEPNEVVLQKNEDIAKGVEFVVKELNNDSGKQNYFAKIKEDLDKFFKSYPKNEELENKVFGSKWVKISADTDYSLGVIFDDDEPSIIAIAEPYEDKSQIDCSKLQLGEWLKIEEKDNKNRGYFIFYQDAKTGKMILST